MNQRELLNYTPQPKHCMADQFDAAPGTQCPNDRDRVFRAWFSQDDLLENPDVRVRVCELHFRYRENGGTAMGPVVLRAAAEALKKQLADKRKKS